MDETADVVVIGAGIVGASVAYYLSVEGLEVCLMDKDSICAGASGVGTGSIGTNGQDFQAGAHFLLGVEAQHVIVPLIYEVEEETGIDTHFQRKPGLSLALEEEEEKVLGDIVTWTTPFREKAPEMLSREEVLTLEPRLTPSVRCGVFSEGGGTTGRVDPARLTSALVRGVEKRGGRVLLREATGLERNGDRVRAVLHTTGKVACGDVVIAMGAWSGIVSGWLSGYTVPVTSHRGEKTWLRFDGAPLEVQIASPRRGHMLTMKDGTWSIGSLGGRHFDHPLRAEGLMFDPKSPPEPVIDFSPSKDGQMELLRRAVDVLPGLDKAEVFRPLSGPRPLSADCLPLIGPVPGWRGVYLATGHNTKGIHLSAITGRIITDFIARGRNTLPLPVEPFLPSRFAWQ